MAGLMKPDEDSANVTFPPPFIYLGMLLLGLLADRLLNLVWPLAPELRIAAAAVFAPLGLAVGLPAQRLFTRAGTDVKPWKTSSAIVRHGIYRFTRNPMYLGMALLYLGLALALASVSALVLFPVLLAVIQTQVIAREERYLEAKFGEGYRSYKAAVRRWI
jgi:protein-S-isoprenylcysteine O-methyltransferase Ste14